MYISHVKHTDPRNFSIKPHTWSRKPTRFSDILDLVKIPDGGRIWRHTDWELLWGESSVNSFAHRGNMIIRCYRLNARPCFFFFFFFFLGGGGGLPKNKKTSICIMDLHNLQQLWISIIALWVNMFARLWISICSVLAVHYGYPWYNYGYPER